MKFLSTSEKVEVKSYPYGSLRTSAFFSLEFNRSKGFRTVFQTVNPKTGRLNNEKKGTYSPLIFMIEKEDNFISYQSGSFNGVEALNRDSKLVYENYSLFTWEQIEHLYLHVILMLKLEANSLATYCGSDLEKIKTIIGPVIDVCVSGLKTKENLFDKIYLDVEAINSLKVKDFKPFRAVEYDNVVENKMNNPVVTQISDHDKRNGETIETIQAEENVKVLLNKTLGYYKTKEL